MVDSKQSPLFNAMDSEAEPGAACFSVLIFHVLAASNFQNQFVSLAVWHDYKAKGAATLALARSGTHVLPSTVK